MPHAHPGGGVSDAAEHPCEELEAAGWSCERRRVGEDDVPRYVCNKWRCPELG
jgi:hypothetical protein